MSGCGLGNGLDEKGKANQRRPWTLVHRAHSVAPIMCGVLLADSWQAPLLDLTSRYHQMAPGFFDCFYDYFLTFAVVLSLLLTIFLATLPSQYQPSEPSHDEYQEQEQGNSSSENGRAGSSASDAHSQALVSVQIVVLGDIGRSPRMQYHALSIAKHGGSVAFIGYAESEIPENIISNPRITVVPLLPTPNFLHTSNKLLFLLTAPLKVLWQVCSLYFALAYRTTASKWMLVQNPPSIPTLAIAFFVAFVRNTKLIIDWHNFGYSILAIKLGPTHPLVRISRLYEHIFSKTASIHLTVTNAMAHVLKESFNEEALPLHDRPAEHFQPLSSSERSKFLRRLPETAPHAREIESGKVRLVVSSTSWTADEDFSLLLAALLRYSSTLPTSPTLPTLLVLITGKGPQKQHYLSQIAEFASAGKLAGVTVKTAWLSMRDYALLLGCADLGVCLHTSSSGVDLPMKVVDMFGAGLPVVGWSRFEAWPELVTEGVNGKGFGSADELCGLLVDLFGDGGKALGRLRGGAMEETGRRWDDEWDPVMGRVLGFVE